MVTPWTDPVFPDAVGIVTTGLVIDNGSSLSRIERIAALPLAGIDGTAQRRLGNSPARGQAHIKTGTIDHVRALAGYVLDRHGRRHALVMMVNHEKAAHSQAAQDALLEWVWAGR